MELWPVADENTLKRMGDKFPELHPKITLLGRNARRAIREKETSFFIDIYRANLFPDLPAEEVTHRFQGCMNRGIQTVNSLCDSHLEEEVASEFKLREVDANLNLFEWVQQALDNRKRANETKNPPPKWYLNAYTAMRSMGIGYRIGTIDQCTWVLHSLRYFRQAVQRLENLLQVNESRAISREGFSKSHTTRSGITIYTADDDPVKARVKYLKGNDPSQLKYDSILVKMFLRGLYPEEITDYIGAEFVVEDEDNKERLMDQFRRSRPTSKLETFKRIKKGDQVNQDSSSLFGVTKFVMRVPVKPLDAEGEVYERIPIEVQILTLQDVQDRISIPEATHREYERRKFLRLFPAVFQKKVYEPVLREKGVTSS